MKKIHLLLLLFITTFSFSQTETINSKVIIDSDSAVLTDKILNVVNYLDESVFNVDVVGDVGIGDPTISAKVHIKGDGGNIFKTESDSGQTLLQVWEDGSVFSNGIIDDNSNTVFGWNAGINEVFTTGYFGFGKFNTYLGAGAGFQNTTGQQNTFVGTNSGFQNTTGFRNTTVGNQADVPQDGNGNDNITIGVITGTPILNGDRNLLIGNEILGFSNALDNVSDAVFLGDRIDALGDGIDTSVNEIVIGSGAVGNGSNTATLGNNSITNTYLKGAVNASSYVKTAATSDDILLGDGTTTSLSGIGGKFVDGVPDATDAVYMGGAVGIGIQNPDQTQGVLHLSNDGRNYITNDSYRNSSFGGGITIKHARGTYAAPISLNQDDYMSLNQFAGYNGNNFDYTVEIAARVENVPNGTLNQSAGYLTFGTKPTGFSFTPVRQTITSTGEVGIGNHTPTARLHVKTDLLTDEIIKAETAIGNINFLVTKDGTIPYPLVTQAQRLAITTPATGLHVYQTDGTEGVYVNKSTGWVFAY